jgi:membrane protease YdiL (CAAX protease family)
MKEPGPYLPGAVWTYGDAAGVFFSGLVGSVIALAVLVWVTGSQSPSDVSQLVVSSIGQALATLAVLTYLSRRKGTSSWDLDFGFRFRAIDGLGLLYGVALQYAVVLLVLLPLAYLLRMDELPQQSVAKVAGEAASPVARIVVFTILVVVAPVLEELLFRGVLLSRLRRSMSASSAILVSAAVFAAIHLIDPNARFVVPGLFVIGIVLGYQALRTGRVGLCIATHAGVNLVAAIGLLFGLGI